MLSHTSIKIMLKLSKELDLPIDFVTERIAFLARTGAGKSGGMRVLFEQMHAAGQFCVFIDPKGDAWGIRADGIGKGKPVLIIGGDHADIPLEPTAGKYIADFLVRERVSTVLDMSDLSTQQMWTFVSDLGSRMYKLNRDVMHIFIDEADMIAGQNYFDPHCLHAIQLIQNKGRGRGFGMTIATQRPQILNKTVLNASGTLIAMQTIGDDALKVVKSWLGQTGSKETITAILGELPLLQNREAFVYSPQTLGVEPVRIRFATFQTFDSMRTPRPGEARSVPKSVADIDLTAIQRDMAETIETAKAEDPKTLKKQIKDLEKEITELRKGGNSEVREVEIIKEVPVLDQDAIERLKIAVSDLHRHEVERSTRLFDKVKEAIADFGSDVATGKVYDKLAELMRTEPTLPASKAVENHATRVTNGQKSMPNVNSVVISNGHLPEGEHKILTICGQYPSGADRDQITVLSGFKKSTRDAYINRLSQKGFLEAPRGGSITITNAGLEALGPGFEPLPTGRELQEYWLARLPVGEAQILRFAIENYPNEVSREVLSEETEFKKSTRDAYINRLQTKRLMVACGPGRVKASDNLFD